jgi:oligoribonuclease NrnB/cAMP/cGMP phosphodiesterase (DHH superfamily)
MKPLVIYHADCTDGFGAAFAAWLKLGDAADYLPMQYGAKNYEFPSIEREVYILDFSFPRSTMDYIFSYAKRVVWLDHHKTAFEMWCPTEQEFYEERVCSYGHHIVLDNNKSGALLAWEYFHPHTEVPMLIRHIDDRDRWQFKLDGSKELHAALASIKPWNFEQWKDIWKNWMSGYDGIGNEYIGAGTELYTQGAAILRAQDAHIKSMLKQARKCEIWKLTDGAEIEHQFMFSGLALNTPSHVSEVGHELANQSGTYGLVWYLGADSRVKCSLRSNGDYDVSGIARVFGGGGHRNAAGFEIDIETLMGWLK